MNFLKYGVRELCGDVVVAMGMILLVIVTMAIFCIVSIDDDIIYLYLKMHNFD